MLGRPRKNPLVLTQEERQALEVISTSRTESQRLVQGAKIILASMKGHTNREVAASVHMSESYVAQFLRRVPVMGALAALRQLPQTTHPLRISSEAREWIRDLASMSPKDVMGAGTQDAWSMDSLAKFAREHCEERGLPQLKAVAKSTVWHILSESHGRKSRKRVLKTGRKPQGRR